MQLTVLGCQAGVPRHGRPSSGYLVSDAGTSVLLDCGPGVATALSATGVRPDAIVVSHLHLDHVHDLLVLAKQLVVEQLATGRTDLLPPVPLHAPAGAAAVFAAWSALFPVPTHPLLDRAFVHGVDVREYAPGSPVAVGGLELTPHAMVHAVPACGLRVEGPGGVLAFTGDTGAHDGIVPLARDADLFLAEATLDVPDTGSHGHLCAADAARAAADAGARTLVLTHLPAGDDATATARREAAAAVFPGPVEVVAPGDVLGIGAPTR